MLDDPKLTVEKKRQRVVCFFKLHDKRNTRCPLASRESLTLSVQIGDDSHWGKMMDIFNGVRE